LISHSFILEPVPVIRTAALRGKIRPDEDTLGATGRIFPAGLSLAARVFFVSLRSSIRVARKILAALAVHIAKILPPFGRQNNGLWNTRGIRRGPLCAPEKKSVSVAVLPDRVNGP
jgi:hypothetical protein